MVDDGNGFEFALYSGLYVRSVTFTLTATGRASGECYVELTDAAAVEEAKKFDKKEMSSRYIEGILVPALTA